MSAKTIQGSRGDMQKGKGIYGRTKTIQGEQRGYVEGQGDIWENKDDTREQRGYVEGTGIYGSTKTIQGSRGDIQKGKGMQQSTGYISPLLSCIVIVLSYFPVPSTYTLYSLVSSLHSRIYPYLSLPEQPSTWIQQLIFPFCQFNNHAVVQ